MPIAYDIEGNFEGEFVPCHSPEFSDLDSAVKFITCLPPYKDGIQYRVVDHNTHKVVYPEDKSTDAYTTWR
jgi:hypothetical protein